MKLTKEECALLEQWGEKQKTKKKEEAKKYEVKQN